MKSTVRRFLELLGLAALGTIVVATIVALRHMIETPQPLESILPGEERIYRWQYGHISYKVLGAVDAPPLVLLHTPGVRASAHEMRKIIEPLAQQYCVYTPDLLGFGLSDRPHIDYSAETYITLCHDFLTKVVKEPATLLASGLSCNYVVAVATRFPELCKGLVLISPTALFAERQKQNLLSALSAVVEVPVFGSILYPLLSTRSALRYALERQHSHYTTPELNYLYATTHRLGAQYAPMAFIAGKLAQNVSQQFERLQQPTLVIWGAHALNNTRYITARQELSKGTQVVLIQGTGPYVHEERPETVVVNIREWSQEGKAATASTPTAKTSKPAGSGPPSEEARGASVPEGEASEPAVASTSAAEEDTATTASMPQVEAYCVKCKKKVPMQNPHKVTMKNGRPALQGTCPTCGTRLYRIGKG